MMSSDVVLLAKSDDFSQKSRGIAEVIFGSRLRAHLGSVGDPFPTELLDGKPALLLSFLSPWIVPAQVLANSTVALNFHPASVDYPGIGCYNFALYDQAAEFGAVCHHMLPKVDSGTVVEERRFAVFDHDTVESLKLRTMVTMLAMFHDICSALASGSQLAVSPHQWSRVAYTRREMNALKTISPEMSADEVSRRIRAGVYPGYSGPSVTIAGFTFYYPVPDRAPIA